MVDVRLPDGDGQQFLERAITLPRRTAVVIHDRPRLHRERGVLHAGGAFDYLIKPFSPGQIEIILKKGQRATGSS